MMRLLILFAAAALMPAAVQAAERTFTRDGHTYVYSTSTRDDGRTLIEGHEVGSAARFRLLVDGTRVAGQANGHPVSFRTSRPLGGDAAIAN
ncbi:MAG: hypothetical protein DI544_09295 [Sphingomonas taxi]|uniref:Uncharacterized protein n=1 Tax=Sphingomonas taxi TaxID=1549858 RepID=A0A2W5R9U2_9SPHN|nr:MAG: hypothetical protein DI544_09295 [Sphingomonas taxi]